MRGGQNRKSVEEHIADGTYRADRHGLMPERDSEILGIMKSALYKKFKKLDKILEQDVTKENVNYYLSVIKTYDAISRNPAQPKAAEKPGKMEL